MSSLSDFLPCACGGVLDFYLNLSTQEETKHCRKCGKHYVRTYDFYSNEYSTKELGGFGCVRLVDTNQETHYYPISSKREAMSFYERAQIKEFDSFIHSSSYIYFYDPQLEKGKVVWGGGQPEEYYKESSLDDNETSEAFHNLLHD